MKKAALIIALMLSACSGKSAYVEVPVGIGSGANKLKASPCNCGGLESKEEHKKRQKLKKEAAKSGEIHTNIVKDDN